jgi:hypothetical protein
VLRLEVIFGLSVSCGHKLKLRFQDFSCFCRTLRWRGFDQTHDSMCRGSGARSKSVTRQNVRSFNEFCFVMFLGVIHERVHVAPAKISMVKFHVASWRIDAAPKRPHPQADA